MKEGLRSRLQLKITAPVMTALLVGLIWYMVQVNAVHSSSILVEKDFIPAAPQGFGDRDNGWAWSMQWWQGHLYVGTNHAFRCAEVAAINRFFPRLSPYPPSDPDVQCPPDPANLDLRAEIWRWSPETNTWERVYRAPNDVPIPNRPGKFVARDIGYRGMNVFTDPDGTEALYVAGVSSQFLWLLVPPPRILRSTDGRHFEPVPQQPGTVLGDFEGNGFRNQTNYKNRFYIIGGVVQGSGVLLEAENPAGGNDNFRVVSPPDVTVSAVEPYNGYLYVGVRDLINGYSVLKTDATGRPPYRFTTVIEPGAYLPPEDADSEILDMKVFDNRLYLGSNGIRVGVTGLAGPAELIRINPDDSWDVVVGNPRRTPAGWKYPLSGFEAGFGNFFNGHMWRLGVYEKNLYVGTFDSSTVYKDNPLVAPILRPIMGFDFYGSPNGVQFFPITTRGFGDRFNFGVRSLEATPHGFFLGTANYYYGLQIWRTRDGAPETVPSNQPVYLPLITRDSSGPQVAPSSAALSRATGASGLARLRPPGAVEAELLEKGVVISWQPVPGAVRYRIIRTNLKTVTLALDSNSIFSGDMRLPERAGDSPRLFPAAGPIRTTIWDPVGEVGSTSDRYFVDGPAEPGHRYIYYVEAVGRAGNSSAASNMVPAPGAAPPVTFSSLNAYLDQGRTRALLTAKGESQVRAALTKAQKLAEAAEFTEAVQVLSELQATLNQADQRGMPAWLAADWLRLLAKLERRLWLAQMGFLQAADLA